MRLAADRRRAGSGAQAIRLRAVGAFGNRERWEGSGRLVAGVVPGEMWEWQQGL